MKKKYILLMLPLMLSLASCNFNFNSSESKNDSSNSSEVIEESSQDKESEHSSSSEDSSSETSSEDKTSETTTEETSSEETSSEETSLEESSSENSSETTTKGSSVTIYSVNDTHGDLLRDTESDSYGFDGLKYFMDTRTKTKNYENPSFICLGDMFQGQYVSNVTRGDAVVDVLNDLNCKAFVVGNHEFDWGLKTFGRFKDGNPLNGELNCDILGANIIDESTNAIPTFLKPYTTFNSNGHKIGLMGFMGEGLESSIAADKIKGYHFSKIEPLATEYAKTLREQGCDTVLIGIHDYEINTFKSLAKIPSGIDGIFGGHTHRYELDQLTNVNGDTIYSMQAKCNNEAFGEMHFEYQNDVISSRTCEVINNDMQSPTDKALANKIKTKYKKEFADGDEVLSTSFPQKTRDEWRDIVATELSRGNNVEAGIVNSAGVRSGTDFYYSVNKNTLYMKQLFRVLPFDNEILTIKLPINLYNRIKTNYHLVVRDHDIAPNAEEVKINIIDYVFYGAYDRAVWDNATVISNDHILLRNYIGKQIKANY